MIRSFALDESFLTTILTILPNRADRDPNVPLKFVAHVTSYRHKASEHCLLASCPSTCRLRRLCAYTKQLTKFDRERDVSVRLGGD